ncbi:telomeric repeat-binding factor 2-interacting protein 1-like [Plakobranchus ocellatus]|uniref:Telomeric repeat-binding factor 2-interacting protein 1 n=1 Tax=Plakobranchus ocellatus TaxID=259542 RepID=A0AAV4D3Q4_9GAST|nr:telomeric repeat-binding factor 2-interacting protein 1-like [Plakobranchus ocellatus]
MAVRHHLGSVKYFRFSRTLFTEEDGAPCLFYFEDNLPDLLEVIHKGSGELADSPNKAKILLCENKSDRLVGQGYLPLEYVIDCVKKNTLLDKEQYRAQKLADCAASTSHNVCSTPAAAGQSTSSAQDNDMDSDEASFWQPSSIVRIQSSSLAGRSKYTDCEDFKIIRHLIVHKKYRETGGNLVWKQMEALKVTSHTHQSMKARFKKKILPELDSYDIPDKWKALLCGQDVGFTKYAASPAKKLRRSVSPEVDLTFESLEAWKHKEQEKKSGREEKSSERLPGEPQIDQFPEDDDLNTQDLDELDRLILQEANVKSTRSLSEKAHLRKHQPAQNLAPEPSAVGSKGSKTFSCKPVSTSTPGPSHAQTDYRSAASSSMPGPSHTKPDQGSGSSSRTVNTIMPGPLHTRTDSRAPSSSRTVRTNTPGPSHKRTDRQSASTSKTVNELGSSSSDEDSTVSKVFAVPRLSKFLTSKTAIAGQRRPPRIFSDDSETEESQDLEMAQRRVKQHESEKMRGIGGTVESEFALRLQAPFCCRFKPYHQHPGFAEGLKA